jgi:hypothetical protein
VSPSTQGGGEETSEDQTHFSSHTNHRERTDGRCVWVVVVLFCHNIIIIIIMPILLLRPCNTRRQVPVVVVLLALLVNDWTYRCHALFMTKGPTGTTVNENNINKHNSLSNNYNNNNNNNILILDHLNI